MSNHRVGFKGIFLSLFFCIALLSVPAFANPDFDAGMAEYNKSHWAAAANKFNLAFKKEKNPKARYMLGICHQRLNHTKLAKADFDWVTIYGKDESLKMAAHQGLDQIEEYRSMMPCNNPECLNWGHRGWERRPNGEYWCYFSKQGDMTHYVSEHHLNHVVRKQPDGSPLDVGACPVCNGTGKMSRPKKLPLT